MSLSNFAIERNVVDSFQNTGFLVRSRPGTANRAGIAPSSVLYKAQAGIYGRLPCEIPYQSSATAHILQKSTIGKMIQVPVLHEQTGLLRKPMYTRNLRKQGFRQDMRFLWPRFKGSSLYRTPVHNFGQICPPACWGEPCTGVPRGRVASPWSPAG